MNKPLLGSLVAATLLLGNASAATMFERFEAMELEMKRLQTELADLKAEKAKDDESPAARAEDEEDEQEADVEDDEGEEPDEEAADADEGEEGEYDENDAEDDDEESIEDIVAELQEEVQDLTKATSGNHLKLSIDFRSAIDSVKYDMAGTQAMQMVPSNFIPSAVLADQNIVPDTTFVSPTGAVNTVDKTHKNNDIITNRLWLNMNWQANENISFTGQLAYHKTYGARSGNSG